MNKLNKKGFTLIELLVVIAIIAVLVAIIVPTVVNAQNRAAAAANAANLRSTAASVSIKLTESAHVSKLQEDATITVTDLGLIAPEMKAVDGVTGGDFTCKIDNGLVVCTFGDDGTIENYATIASGETLPAVE